VCDGAQMANFWRFLGPAFPVSRVQHISDLHSKFALGPHHMCTSMVDIQSATAEIRRGIKKKKEEERKKLQGKNIMVCPIPYRAAIIIPKANVRFQLKSI